MTIYSPIVKSKRGEATAIFNLSQSVKDNIAPFFDILAMEEGVLGEEKVQEHLEKQALNIIDAWSDQGTCYIDFFDLASSARCLNGVHPLTFVFGHVMCQKVRPIPVVGIERDIPYKMAVRNLIYEGVEAIALRLGKDDIQLPSSLCAKVSSLIYEIGATDLPLHVFIDFRSLEVMSSGEVEKQVRRVLEELKKINPKRIVFCASAIAPSMALFKKDSINRIERTDYLIWRNLVKSVLNLDFSDYGVIHPSYIDIDPRLLKPSAKIRYTTSSGWIIIKGSCWRDDTSQHHELSKMLSDQQEFRGDDSWGGNYIVSCAEGRPSYGSLETWVSVDQNNHINQTVKQILRISVAVRHNEYN